jgi:hypothetical protein
MRVRYTIAEQQTMLIDEDILRDLASSALSIRFQPDIVQVQSRARMPQMTESAASSPLVALETYLDDVAPERKDRLLAHARLLAADLNSECTSDDAH